MTHYALLKHLHLLLAAGSVGFFVLRWLEVLGGASWPLKPWARRVSAVWDTALLLAGLSLWTLLHLNPLVNTWLGAKLLWLLAYIVCGLFALKRAPTRGGKLLAGLAALGCVAMIVRIAMSHQP